MNTQTRNLVIIAVVAVIVVIGAYFLLDNLGVLPGATVTINGCVIQAGAQCPGVNLTGANLNGKSLNGANLKNAIITNTTFSRTDLRGANLQGATGWSGYSQTDAGKQCNTVLPSGETKTVFKDC